MKRGTSYGEQVETFLEDQFKKWTSTQDTGFEPRTSLRGAFTVPKDQIVAFINKARLEKDMNIKKLPNACNFVGWKKLYQQMMNLKTSELLDAMFKNYSIWRAEGVPREMTREKIREFLQPPGSMGNQNQDNVTEEDLTNIIKVHLVEVLLKFYSAIVFPRGSFQKRRVDFLYLEMTFNLNL